MLSDPMQAGSARAPVIQLDKIALTFGKGATAVPALRDISLSLYAGQALALVGESGCGKTTCAKVIGRMFAPTGGNLIFDGAPFTARGSAQQEYDYRRAVQMIFQDPFASLNPVYSIGHHIMRPIRLHAPQLDRAGSTARLHELLAMVGLDPELVASRFPHQLSGGQRQRVNIARALAVGPRVLLADEPTSMLDVSIRAEILSLLGEVKRAQDLALLYITHDITTAAEVAENIAVMFGGQVLEWGRTQAVLDDPRHPYTQMLLDSVPDSRRRFQPGQSARLLDHARSIRQISRPFSTEVEQIGPDHFLRRNF